MKYLQFRFSVFHTRWYFVICVLGLAWGPRGWSEYTRMDAARGIPVEVTFAQVFAVLEVRVFLWPQTNLSPIPPPKSHALIDLSIQSFMTQTCIKSTLCLRYSTKHWRWIRKAGETAPPWWSLQSTGGLGFHQCLKYPNSTHGPHINYYGWVTSH